MNEIAQLQAALLEHWQDPVAGLYFGLLSDVGVFGGELIFTMELTRSFLASKTVEAFQYLDDPTFDGVWAPDQCEADRLTEVRDDMNLAMRSEEFRANTITILDVSGILDKLKAAGVLHSAHR